MTMTPLQKAVTSWERWWGEDRYSEENTHAMCDAVIALVLSGKYDAVEFNLFSEHEKAIVDAYMQRVAPDVKYVCSFLVRKHGL